MLVTEEIFRAFLKCETKSHLLWSGVVGEQRDFTDWQARQVEAYKQKGLAQPRAKLGEDESLVCEGTPSDFKSAKFSLVIETELQAEGLQAKIHALERVAPSDNKKHSSYLPIRFFPNEKITSQDKLLLAFDALVLASVSGHQPSLGKIIHGAGQKATKVQLPDLIKTAKAIVGKISAQQASPSPPPLILNKHCVECEFKARCRQVAVEKDELSLLSGLNEKERKKQHSKGIFTVTQLSYTYRPRRRPKRLASKPDNYSHALRALAIRENKIHIAGSPKLNITGTPVYLDVEGVPDRDFYYLIGLRIKSGDAYVQHSFWANDASEEKAIWVSFLQALAQIENPQLVHYGSYETTFLKQMKQRYGNAVENGVALDELIKGAVNVLSAIYAQIYFPTYSNSLKEIAPYLGFQWSESKASGLTSLVWRYGWEITEDAGLRKKLVAYNDEDCEALESVSNAVAQLIVQQSQKIGINENDVIYADSMKRENFHRYGDKKLSTPEFDYVNQAAYWNYQREKVYVRSGKRVRQATPKSTRGRSKNLPINKVIESQHPASCPKCGATEFQKREAVSKILFDIKFSQSGVKRWVIKYVVRRYFCFQCDNSFRFLPKEWAGRRYGVNVISYLVYQLIDLRLTHRSVAQNLNQIFGFDLTQADVHREKSRASQAYKETYDKILKKLVAGNLIHADETKVSVKGKSEYVWVFTSLEEVIYIHKETREGEFLQEWLKEFKGVLVSDFYAAYDSINCPQQKCLIHLMRDLNDDLLKNPYNQEMKILVKEFGLLLRSIVETIDRFGLKAHFLRKHKVSADRFFTTISRSDFQSEIAIHYKTRFDKNRNKLFTFLDYDGIPWNNNNAEHAIKSFAKIRQVIGGSSTAKGISDYLTFLSICETCRYKKISFLNFLRSGEKDIDTFIKLGGPLAKQVSPTR